MTRSKKITTWTIVVVLLLGSLVVGAVGLHLYTLTRQNLYSRDGQTHSYYIYPNTTMAEVYEMLEQDYAAHIDMAWRWHRQTMAGAVAHTGYYALPAQMSDRRVLRTFSHGEQTPVHLTFTNTIRTREQLAGRLAAQIMVDSTELISRLDSDAYMQQYGFCRENALCLFLPNTYEVYWDISADDLMARMYTEYTHFWTEERVQKAQQKGLTPIEVSIVASIVEGETYRTSEQAKVASVYINRLRKGMRLESCPTVIYATGQLDLRRVLYEHLQFDSPYNTYKYAGLPPGPIRCPQLAAIDAVLDAPETDYLFLCANPDFSGTHIFSSNYRQHAAIAKQYQRVLNQKGL